MILFAVILVAIIALLVYFFVFSAKKKTEGEDLGEPGK
jgi:hypothetical protein